MINLTALSLKPRMAELIKMRKALRASMAAIKDKSSDYAKHHQNLINVYSGMIETLDYAIQESESTGQG